jgi:hypothetical protein
MMSIHSLQADNDSAVVEGCVAVRDTHNESSCPQGYQFESDRGDWTAVTEVNRINKQLMISRA